MSLNIIADKLPSHFSKRYKRREDNEIDTLVVHHGASFASRPRGGWLAYICNIADYHVWNRGWPGIAYHYVIAPDGETFKCQSIRNISYHAKGGNTHGIGICLLGNFENEQPPARQVSALHDLIVLIKRGLPGVENVIGHRDVKGSSTVCPGKQFTPAMIQQCANLVVSDG